jgi:RNA polymerase sigma-54 factor
VTPDVVVHRVDDDFKIEIVESSAARLRLEPMYASLASDLRQNELIRTNDERGHVRHHVSRARLFLLAIAQRHETLKRITACLMELQRDYVDNGVRALRPLTRGQVAEYVGLHESTVSRATAGKYVMLPNREVVPFSTFFAASLSTKDIMREIIEHEDRAMTDEEIGQRLQSQGIRIARRTVAKYRATLGILPSTYRYGHTVSQEASVVQAG